MRKEITEGKNREEQEKTRKFSSFMGWNDVDVVCWREKQKCERKILVGKKYEKCNKFYYYDVSTSLVCIKREISFVGSM